MLVEVSAGGHGKNLNCEGGVRVSVWKRSATTGIASADRIHNGRSLSAGWVKLMKKTARNKDYSSLHPRRPSESALSVARSQGVSIEWRREKTTGAEGCRKWRIPRLATKSVNDTSKLPGYWGLPLKSASLTFPSMQHIISESVHSFSVCRSGEKNRWPPQISRG